MTVSLLDKKIWVAGHRGLLGSALVRRLKDNCRAVVTADRTMVDLKDQRSVDVFLAREKPDIVIIAAAKVGGIGANTAYPADFILDNVIMTSNIVRSALAHDIGKLVHVASSAAYPAGADQPMAEEALLTGLLDPTHEAYGMAKLTGIMMMKAIRQQYRRDFFSVLPCNLYGPGANFDPQTSHFIPALIRRAHEAKLAQSEVLRVWGTGKPRREVLYVDDCADAIAFLLQHDPGSAAINIGAGVDHPLCDYARMISNAVGYNGRIDYDPDKPDGVSQRLMDTGRLNELGWRARMPLEQGLEATYRWFREHHLSVLAA